jgi:hypothetical protein
MAAVTRLTTCAGPALLLALLLGLLAGCSGSTPKPHPAAPPPPTPIAQLNTAVMTVHRIPFCDLLPRQAVTDALGQKAADHEAWRYGDASRFVGGPGDRAQEFGCRYSAGGAVAEAWVFASPVDSSLARQVIRDTVQQSGCRELTAASFGTPSVDQLCHRNGGMVRVRHAGLFGQSWLTCQLSAPLAEATVERRADAWCVQVANSLNTSR